MYYYFPGIKRGFFQFSFLHSQEYLSIYLNPNALLPSIFYVRFFAFRNLTVIAILCDCSILISSINLIGQKWSKSSKNQLFLRKVMSISRAETLWKSAFSSTILKITKILFFNIPCSFWNVKTCFFQIWATLSRGDKGWEKNGPPPTFLRLGGILAIKKRTAA